MSNLAIGQTMKQAAETLTKDGGKTLAALVSTPAVFYLLNRALTIFDKMVDSGYAFTVKHGDTELHAERSQEA